MDSGVIFERCHIFSIHLVLYISVNATLSSNLTPKPHSGKKKLKRSGEWPLTPHGGDICSMQRDVESVHS